MGKNRNSKNLLNSAARMAVRAVENSSRSVDLQVTGVDPAPGALDLPDVAQPCSSCGRPAVDRCGQCGSTPCGE
jgi:hypothetical protein